MKELTKKELNMVAGGALSLWAIAGIIAGAIFGIGVIDGIVRPLKCNKWKNWVTKNYVV